VKGQPRVNPVVFANQHPSGRHVLKTAGHVFACIDGVIHDTVKPLPTRCVYGFWEAVPVSK
jgi:hypothetical protein